ncbi:FtsX-like permease family protein [Thalassotalea sp. M1531]|uniref:FtsX-like permease family protein n=1 Tax=Thalassotalea algicola TaxID=2716224 RepID=A0A7Y0LG30_9GAMM|nr:FtsX-like permease family protein [Thalassotalea algicola]NMP33507.1 FtsX-like permease family protein [Thalassotalea algicola]
MSNNVWIKQSLRLLGHELRRGELTIIFLAIVLAVATVFSLSGFSHQIQAAILSKSTSFIAADRVFRSSQPIEESILAKSDELGLESALKLEMGSMVFANDKLQLAEISAVGDKYPLRGELLIQNVQGGVKEQKAPKPGQIWVEQKLLDILGITIGENLEVGMAPLEVAGVIKQMPDASFSVFTSGPALILNVKDMPKTELIQPGSRLGYKALFAGESDAIEEFEEWIKPQVNETQRWYDIQSSRSALSASLDSAEQYLTLASMLGIVLAAVAVAVASRRYGQRHQPMVAVFKAMGASQRHITKLYFLHWGLLSAISVGAGLLIGYVLQEIGLNTMQEQFELTTRVSMMEPLVIAIITGVLCSVAFAIAPLKQLVTIKPLAVIRGFEHNTFHYLQMLPAILALYTLLHLFSRDWLKSVVLLGGGALVSIILLVLGQAFVSAGRSVGSKSGRALHLAFANLKRRAKENSVQLVSFTIAIKLLLLIVVIRSDLIGQWQAQLPDNTANRFLINISEQQVDSVNQFMEELAIPGSGLYPVVRGRLTAINQDSVTSDVSKEEDKDPEQQRRGVGRELNLTWRTNLPDNNEIISGQWYSAEEDKAQVSVESGVAERLDINVGDSLGFQIGSENFVVEVTSIRKVDWQSLQPNFFMIFNPQVLSDFPATYISSHFVEPEKVQSFNRFLAQYPTISMIDVEAMIGQLRSVIDQVSLAIEFILVMVVIAGSLVLIAQVQASMEEREREIAILRTLGAKGSLLKNSVLLEFVCLGLVAGLMAGMAMEIAVYFIQTQVFKMSASFHLEYWGIGMVAGATFVGVMGMISCWRLLNMSSVTLIRRTM